MRLNGWQRIGIVASVLWAVGAFLVVAYEPDWASSLHRACLAATPEVNHAEWADRCYSDFKERLPRAMADKRYQALMAALVPVPIGWLVVYMVVGIVRWVRRGFKPA